MATHQDEMNAQNQIIPDGVNPQTFQPQQTQIQPDGGSASSGPRRPKGPSVRRACIACHAGKTRCSESLPCQNCLKRGLGNVCAYPDPDSEQQPVPGRTVSESSIPGSTPSFSAVPPPPPPPVYAASAASTGINLSHQQYYDYNGQLTGASSTTFRPAKRVRTLTEEETAAITRNFSRGDFFVGTSAPVRIDPRLPVKLTLGDGDHVHFNVGNYEA
ncbi:hypothetical protein FB45DRAFT_949362 [Roridomyces roridus]|uniref:Zn(2)-C6 fungal-type domain-containing protein n=1 Tax=Roridomyces roridus TaxID=1738132 RepID=A0AAD7B0N5_9AGAR|nr:hypothetical protein FB45DRAFT_949362 [Roridomyces roridus]